jgi:hypothetical protein
MTWPKEIPFTKSKPSPPISVTANFAPRGEYETL